MGRVITLIAGAGGRGRIGDAVAALAARLPLAAAPDWLAPGEACDLALDDAPGDPASAIRAAIGDAAIDAIVQPEDGRRKRILVADMESTIIENEMLDELADFIGRRAEIAEVTRRAMNGELDFAAALTARVALFEGLPASVLDAAAARIRVTPGARALVATMRRGGAVTALVSGGFSVFVEPVAQALGFDRVSANVLEMRDGVIAGTVRRPLATAATKRAMLISLAAELGAGPAEALAVGDGANDLPMLEAAGLGIAFRAKPAVAAASRWRVDHADLTALLYAQGYRKREIVEG